MYYRSLDAYPQKTSKKSAAQHIEVSGEGRLSVAPDQAEVNVGVETENRVLQKAQEENALAIQQILQAMHRIGITDENIQTTHFSVYPQYDYVDGKQVFRNYKVTHILRIKVTNINETGLVVDTAVNNGANTVSGIEFTLSDPSRFEQQALALAVIDATKKAETIAKTMRVQLIKPPIFVNELPQRTQEPIPYGSMAMVKSESSVAIQPGTLNIYSRLVVRFAFES